MWPLLVVGVAALVYLATRGNGRFPAFPVDGAGRTSSLYGFRISPISGNPTCHRGIDFARPTGTPVRSVDVGVVLFSSTTPVGGNTIIIDHGDEVHTHYLHLSEIQVEPGFLVDAGMQIGKVGSTGQSTGPHLHFGLRVDGVYIDPGPFIGLPEGESCD